MKVYDINPLKITKFNWNNFLIPVSPDIVPTPLPEVWRVDEWRLCPCKLLRTGRNGVSDEVYCKVLLQKSKNMFSNNQKHKFTLNMNKNVDA